MRPWPYPRHIAHRGAGRLAPENTLPALDEGARRGYRCVEIDVACTRDGTVVLMHDDTLARTAGSPGLLAEATLADLAALDAGAWLHPRFAGTPIPTLEQALVRCQQLRLQMLIELKVGRGQDAARLGAVAAQLVARRWSGPPPLLISFADDALAAAAGAEPGIPRALLGGDWREDWAARAAACGACAIDLDHRAITPERVGRVHGAGLGLIAWTVNEPDRAADLIAWGVEGVTTDAVDRIAAAQPG
jgi:glycerophosphoryl diester phosphodiesterase